MATTNPFDLLGDDDTDDLTKLIAAQQQKPVPAAQPKKPQAQAAQPKKPQAQAAQPAKPAKLPTKPIPPAQAVKESREPRNEGGRGGGRGFGRGRGGGGFNRDSTNNDNSFGNGFSGGFRKTEDGDSEKPTERRGNSGPRGSFRGGRRGGFSNGEVVEGERPKRSYERRSGTGRGNELKRDGSGRGNWGTPTDEIAPDAEQHVIENEKDGVAEKQVGEEGAADANNENPITESEEKEPEDKEMTLEEYEKILEEKRKALLSLKTNEERKVDDREFQSMQQLSCKKGNDEIFIKLGSDKDKRKDAEKEEKSKKSVVINEFFKSAEGERNYTSRGRGGRDRGGRGDRGSRAGFGVNARNYNVPAPSIEDPGHFPTLGAK